jgi:hypothetical protein
MSATLHFGALGSVPGTGCLHSEYEAQNINLSFVSYGFAS